MLDAAVQVFSRRGFHAANMDEIAELSGVSKPMVYAYLGTKEELFVACLQRESMRLVDNLQAAADPTLPPDQQLWRGMRGFFEFVGAHRDGWSVLYRQARNQHPFSVVVSVMRETVVEVITDRLDAAVRAQGRQAKAEDITAMALTLVGASESLADWLADHPEEDAGRTATRLMNAVWLGAEQLLRGELWRRPDQETPVL
ncbi:TetR/AcrR family transcriptional regulator [Catellatospora tritici]|uniref:TetR/AcrR family transcriptional regulator n=1 Tax=Catellatospora tritici TaxID=2851566 RepID=UPI001C2DAE9E|nr:TetR/AcrR family transcriptional regulator [Catellatospora tritici]MBV1852100.1 TetR/AcrR family transcriptional regulator [Catellatospora tritici]